MRAKTKMQFKAPLKNMLKSSLLILAAISLASCKSSNSRPGNSNPGLKVQKRAIPVLSRQDGLVADPSVIRYQGKLWMVYSDYSLQTDSITFNAATSTDGINWTEINNSSGFRILSGDTTSWDKHIETPDHTIINGSFYLYYIGYPESDFSGDIYESEIGLATGTDITKLSKVSTNPVVPRGGSYDKDALTSPSVVEYNGTYYMMYTGWKNISSANGFLGQTGATSTDGISWTKTEKALFPEVQGTKFETATEADLVKGPDGIFYLFFSAEGGIALARSDKPFGPWEMYPDFIIKSDYDWESGEVVAPSALIEDGKAKIWYAGVVGSFAGSSIGYAEIDFPFNWK